MMRAPVTSPAPDLPPFLLIDYERGLSDGQHGRVFEPGLDKQEDQRAAYKAGFDKARTMPRLRRY